MFRPITRDQRLSFALLRPCILNSLFYAIRNEVEKISRTLLNGVVTSAMLHQQTAASTALTALTSAPYSTSNREPFSSLSSSFVLLDIYSAFTSDVRMQKLWSRNCCFLGQRIFSSFSQINLSRQRKEIIIDSSLRIFNCQASTIGKLKELKLKKELFFRTRNNLCIVAYRYVKTTIRRGIPYANKRLLKIVLTVCYSVVDYE